MQTIDVSIQGKTFSGTLSSGSTSLIPGQEGKCITVCSISLQTSSQCSVQSACGCCCVSSNIQGNMNQTGNITLPSGQDLVMLSELEQNISGVIVFFLA